MIREIDLNKKQTKNDFIKSLPGVPGKEFEIKKRLYRLRDIKNPSRKNNNNNNGNYNNNNGGNLFPAGPGDNGSLFPPRLGTGLGLPLPELQNRFNTLRGTSSSPPFFANNASSFHIPAQTSSFNRRSRASAPPPTNNFFGEQTATMTIEKIKDGNLLTKKK